MNEFLEKLKKDIPHFEWKYNESTDSYFGTGKIDRYQFRDENKNTCINGNKSIFISGELYKGEERSFRYGICYQNQLFRRYRGRTFFEKEINKIYTSGKTLDEVYKNLQNEKYFFKFIIEI